jgi:shikimate kinase
MTGFTISDLFARYGEKEFRAGEERVMERLLSGTPCVLSSGGGAFLSEKTRKLASEKAVSVWIKAEADVISFRTEGRTHRPLVPAADNQRIIERLVSECYPIYATADITIPSYAEHPSKTAIRLLRALEEKALISPYRNTKTKRKKQP